MNINDITIDDQFNYASDETLSAGMLGFLANSTDVEVLEALARNANIDAFTIEELAFTGLLDDIDNYYTVRAAIARRDDLPVHVATGLQADPHWAVRAVIAKNAAVAPYLSWNGAAPALATRELVGA